MPTCTELCPGNVNATLISHQSAPAGARYIGAVYQAPLTWLWLGEMTAQAEHPECRGARSRGLVRSRLVRRWERKTAVSDVGQLVRAAAAGDQAAWDRLVERFNGLV